MESGSWVTVLGLILALAAVGHAIQEEGALEAAQRQPPDSEENLVERLGGLVSVSTIVNMLLPTSKESTVLEQGSVSR